MDKLVTSRQSKENQALFLFFFLPLFTQPEESSEFKKANPAKTTLQGRYSRAAKEEGGVLKLKPLSFTKSLQYFKQPVSIKN